MAKVYLDPGPEPCPVCEPARDDRLHREGHAGAWRHALS